MLWVKIEDLILGFEQEGQDVHDGGVPRKPPLVNDSGGDVAGDDRLFVVLGNLAEQIGAELGAQGD